MHRGPCGRSCHSCSLPLSFTGLGPGCMRCSVRRSIFPLPETQRPDAQVLWIESQGERLKVWVVPRAGSKALLYFGGNAEDVAGNIEEFAAAFPDRSLFLVNYRGYGGSSGQPSEAALFADALAIFDHVRREHSEIAVMGRSLGSGVAVFVASERPVERLVLVTAFDSLVNVATEYFRWLPVGWLMRDRYDSARRASSGQSAGAGGDCAVRTRSFRGRDRRPWSRRFRRARFESRWSRAWGTTHSICRRRISRRSGGSYRGGGNSGARDMNAYLRNRWVRIALALFAGVGAARGVALLCWWRRGWRRALVVLQRRVAVHLLAGGVFLAVGIVQVRGQK